jgi:hypothetical protein
MSIELFSLTELRVESVLLGADVIIFNHENIIDNITCEEPTLQPKGIEHMMMNPEIVIGNRQHRGRLPAKVLWQGARQPQVFRSEKGNMPQCSGVFLIAMTLEQEMLEELKKIREAVTPKPPASASERDLGWGATYWSRAAVRT